MAMQKCGMFSYGAIAGTRNASPSGGRSVRAWARSLRDSHEAAAQREAVQVILRKRPGGAKNGTKMGTHIVPDLGPLAAPH